jgi:ribosomal protein L30/L7E
VLRALVLALLLANAGYFAWTQGWLDGVVGVRAGVEREPERLKLQLHPETVQVLPAGGAGVPAHAAASAAPTSVATSVAAPASAAVDSEGSACLEAGPFGATEFAAAETALRAAVPDAAWVDNRTDRPGTYIIYMGRFADRASLEKKKEELARIKLANEELRSSPGLEPGLSLGRFDNRDAAEKTLAQLGLRGVHSARVVEITPVVTTHLLRVGRADAELAAKLGALKLAALGKGFVNCAGTTSPATN